MLTHAKLNLVKLMPASGHLLCHLASKQFPGPLRSMLPCDYGMKFGVKQEFLGDQTVKTT